MQWIPNFFSADNIVNFRPRSKTSFLHSSSGIYADTHLLLLTNFVRQKPPLAHIVFTTYISLIAVPSFNIDFNMSFTKILLPRLSATFKLYLTFAFFWEV